jgi:hypothetical protein
MKYKKKINLVLFDWMRDREFVQTFEVETDGVNLEVIRDRLTKVIEDELALLRLMEDRDSKSGGNALAD